jgi:ribosomal protein S18 acetylase RimI-like enzyme
MTHPAWGGAFTPGSRIGRRAETPADEAFSRDVYAASRDAEMRIVPWDDAQKAAFLRQQFDAQQIHYRREYPGTRFDVILLDNRPIGRLYLFSGPTYFLILDIALLPEFRNAGIGTSVICAIMAQAADAGLPLRLHVETFNPAQRLYDRLGFVREEAVGIHIPMIWTSGR